MGNFRMHVPYKEKLEDGFDVVSVIEDEDDPDKIYLNWQVGHVLSPGECYDVRVNLKRRTVVGTGSKNHREAINKAMDWYRKAMKDEQIAKEIFIGRN